MSLTTEIKRKAFHHLSLVYLLMYAALPRLLTIVVLGLILAIIGAFEFLRLRRPELNAWLIAKFGGIHRESEVMHPSGIFWTLLGCWLTMVVFVDKLIGVTGIGYLVFGDTAAALAGKMWGGRHWKKNPQKTMDGSAAFAVSLCWGLLMVRPHGALVGALFAAWVESRQVYANDNLWIPLAGSFAVSICFGGKLISGNPYIYLLGRTILFTAIYFGVIYGLTRDRKEVADAT